MKYITTLILTLVVGSMMMVPAAQAAAPRPVPPKVQVTKLNPMLPCEQDRTFLAVKVPDRYADRDHVVIRYRELTGKNYPLVMESGLWHHPTLSFHWAIDCYPGQMSSVPALFYEFRWRAEGLQWSEWRRVTVRR